MYGPGSQWLGKQILNKTRDVECLPSLLILQVPVDLFICNMLQPFSLAFPPRSQWWREPSWTPRPMMTTAASTRSSTPRPASTPLPRPPRYTASRTSPSRCPAMPSGSGSPSLPPLATLWWWASSMPAPSDEHMHTKTCSRTCTSCFFRISGPPECRQTHILSLSFSLCLFFPLSLHFTWLLDLFWPLRVQKLWY